MRKALDASAAFADAYYNLALCYEKLGDVEQSRRCWAEYIRLDPDSEWSLVARRRLAGVGA